MVIFNSYVKLPEGTLFYLFSSPKMALRPVLGTFSSLLLMLRDAGFKLYPKVTKPAYEISRMWVFERLMCTNPPAPKVPKRFLCADMIRKQYTEVIAIVIYSNFSFGGGIFLESRDFSRFWKGQKNGEAANIGSRRAQNRDNIGDRHSTWLNSMVS